MSLQLRLGLRAPAVLGVLFLVFASAGAAESLRFEGLFDAANWTISQTPLFSCDPTDPLCLNPRFSNGSVDTLGAPNSVALVSSNAADTFDDQTWFESTLRYLITIPAGVNSLEFQWAYSSVDVSPSFDFGGFYLNGVEQLLTNPGGDVDQFGFVVPQSGSTSVAVAEGDEFGFYVTSMDNAGGSATFEISGAPGGSSVPEPGSGLLLMLGGAMVLGVRRLRRREGRVR